MEAGYKHGGEWTETHVHTNQSNNDIRLEMLTKFLAETVLWWEKEKIKKKVLNGFSF